MDLAQSTTGVDRRRLWALAERVGREFAETTAAVFGDVGLFLEDPAGPDRDGGYDDTPAGSVLIASTGGDGVHFSALLPDARGSAPIVMTTPMVFDNPRTVVGADLREFLALGATSGYSGLEQLAHHVDGDRGRGAMVRRAQHPVPDGTDREVALLDALTREFDLRPWSDVAARLVELEREHGPRVRPAYR